MSPEQREVVGMDSWLWHVIAFGIGLVMTGVACLTFWLLDTFPVVEVIGTALLCVIFLAFIFAAGVMVLITQVRVLPDPMPKWLEFLLGAKRHD